jgi:hemerythrin
MWFIDSFPRTQTLNLCFLVEIPPLLHVSIPSAVGSAALMRCCLDGKDRYARVGLGGKSLDDCQWFLVDDAVRCPPIQSMAVEKTVSEYQLPVVDPDNIPRVALELMNAVHQEEVALVNELGALLGSGLDGTVDEAAISQSLAAWITHTREHFEGENRLMKQHNFPPYPVHKGEHDQMLTQISQLQQAWSEGRDVAALASFLYEAWLPWFDTHVKTMDTVTAGFLNRAIPR